MTSACSAREFAADSHLLKFHCLQNKALRTIGNLPSRIPTRDLHMTFKIPYVYDFVTKLRRQQAEVIQNHENVNVRNTGQAELNTEKNKKAQTWWRSGIRLFKRLSYCYLLW